MKNYNNSQIADNNSTIKNSNNNNQNSNSEINNSRLIKKVRTESAIISFIVGILSSLAASYIFEHFLK